MQSDRRRLTLFTLFTLIVILGILYLRGFFDAQLYQFGINHYPCTHAVGGQIVCGSNVVGTPYNTR